MHSDTKTILNKQKRQISKRVEELLSERDTINLQLEDIDRYYSVLSDVYDYLSTVHQPNDVGSLNEVVNLKIDLKMSVSLYDEFIDLVHENYALKFKTMKWLRHPTRVDITIDKLVRTIVEDQISI